MKMSLWDARAVKVGLGWQNPFAGAHHAVLLGFFNDF